MISTERAVLNAVGGGLLLLLFVGLTAGGTGCFSQNIAEGRYAEASDSGRVQEYEDGDHELDRIQVFRLALVQFDEAGAGVLESFTVQNHATLAQKPLNIPDSRVGYFCTRIHQVAVESDRVIYRYTDELNRSWQVSAAIESDGDILRGELARVAADGQVLGGPENADLLLPEDQHYYSQGRSPSEQLVLERISDEITEADVSCADFSRQDDLVVTLPFDSPQEAVNPRLGLVLTRAETGPDMALPLEGLAARREVLTATLDPVDLLDDERSIVVRSSPDRELMNDIGDGIASGGFIVYDDLDGDNQWDNLRNSPDVIEPVLAYTDSEIVMFNQSEAAATSAINDQFGDRVPGALFSDSTPRVEGWQVYPAFGESLELADGSLVLLINDLHGDPTPSVTLSQVPKECGYCYPAPSAIESNQDVLPDGVDLPDCNDCPSVLPLLFL